MTWMLALSFVLPVVQTSSANTRFAVLSYHEVVDNSRALTYDAITARNLALHFEWLRTNGYHVISVDDIVAANRGERALPPRAVLLTFDDAFRSFYTRVFPLLLAFKYPAVLAVVGSWLEPPPLSRIRYGTKTVPREKFISWWELKEVQASGLVEVASHSYGLHTTTLINPLGSEGPAITRRFSRSGVQSLPDKLLYSLHPPRFGDIRELLKAPYDEYVELVTGLPQSPVDPGYDTQESGYETEAEYALRIRNDLEKNSDLIESKIGVRPRVMVWPYGRNNRVAIEAAQQAGMPLSMNLDREFADAKDLGRIGRFYAAQNPDLGFLKWAIAEPEEPPLVRGLCVNLDEIYAPAAQELDARLGKILELVKRFKPGMVLLSASANPQSAAAGSVYFPNRQLPVRTDLFGRAAWQLWTRTGSEVYAWLPLENVQTGAGTPLELFEQLGRSVLFSGFGFGMNFLAAQLQPMKLPDGFGLWDPRTPRKVRSLQDTSRLSERTRLGLEIIESVARYQSNLKVLDGVELAQLKRPSEIAVDSIDNIVVRWDERPEEALRKLNDLGWLRSPMIHRLVYISARGDPDEWHTLQQAGLLNGIYCPDRLLDRVAEVDAMSAVLGAADYPFRP